MAKKTPLPDPRRVKANFGVGRRAPTRFPSGQPVRKAINDASKDSEKLVLLEAVVATWHNLLHGDSDNWQSKLATPIQRLPADEQVIWQGESDVLEDMAENHRDRVLAKHRVARYTKSITDAMLANRK